MQKFFHTASARLAAILLLLAVTLVLMPHSVKAKGAASAWSKPDFYLRWNQLPSQTLLEMGKQYTYQTDKTDSAMLCYSIVANRYYEQHLEGKELEHSVQAMNGIGYMYFFMYHNYQQSYSTLIKARRIAEKHELREVLAYIHLNLADLYLTSSEIYGTDSLDRVQEAYQLALDEARQTENWKLYVRVFCTYIAYTYGKSLYEPMRKAIKEYEDTPLPADIPLLHYTRLQKDAYLALCNGNYQKALAYCDSMEQSIDIRDTPERPLINVYGLKAHTLSHLGKNEQAMEVYRQMERMAQESGAKDMLPGIYNALWEYYRDEKHDETLAKDYELRYLRAKDSVLMTGQLDDITQMRFLDELQQVNDEVQEMAARQRLYRIAGIAVTAAALVFLVLLIVIVRLYRRQKRKNRLLYENRVELLARERELRQQRDEAIRRHEEEKTAMESAKTDIQETKYQHSQLDDVSRQIILERVEQAMSRPELFCQEGFSINQLAEQVGASYKYVSQVVNEHYARNFSQVLAECRINEACRRLHDDADFRQFKVEAIAAAVGFKSRTNFAATFKRVTGLSPSEYIRQAAQPDA